jgi:uncharacterized phage infection (PIP) family protein YhgE
MNTKLFPALFATLLFAACAAPSASAADTKSQLVQIQTQLQIMQDNMTQMKQSFDERMGVMKDMMTQQVDNVNRMGAAVQSLQKTLGAQTTDASTKVDQISGQVQALHDAVDELKARLAKVSKQLDDIQAGQQSVARRRDSQPHPARRKLPRRMLSTMTHCATSTPEKTILPTRSSSSICAFTAPTIWPGTRSSTLARSCIARETISKRSWLTTKCWINTQAATKQRLPS